MSLNQPFLSVLPSAHLTHLTSTSSLKLSSSSSPVSGSSNVRSPADDNDDENGSLVDLQSLPESIEDGHPSALVEDDDDNNNNNNSYIEPEINFIDPEKANNTVLISDEPSTASLTTERPETIFEQAWELAGRDDGIEEGIEQEIPNNVIDTEDESDEPRSPPPHVFVTTVPDGSSEAAPETSAPLKKKSTKTKTKLPLDTASQGFHLRWSRLQKEVEVKSDSNSGLMRSKSISTPAKQHSKQHSQHSTASTAAANIKVILNQVSGSAHPGEILACMGPSGSGKTSLMNVLSGRSSYQDGVISLNGDPMNQHSMKRFMSRVAYVKQADIFFGHLTVRDQFTYTALLRLPSTISRADKHRQVDDLIRLLRLTKVALSPIRMLSGGEKKRVNIGSELLTNPDVILLDEPTSGLDSTSAVSLLKLLHTLASEQRKTIITTIHQPSSSVFMSFDKLILLSEGNVVYFGTPQHSLQYLNSDRICLPCPPGYNAADHWMDLLVIDSAVEEEREEKLRSSHGAEQEMSTKGSTLKQTSTSTLKQRHPGQDKLSNGTATKSSASTSKQRHPGQEKSNGTSTKAANSTSKQRHPGHEKSNGTAPAAPPAENWKTTAPRLILQQAWDNEGVAEQMDQELKSTPDDASIAEPEFMRGGNKYPTSWWTQFNILMHRALKNSRSAIFTWINMTKSIAIGVITGLLWFQTDYTEGRVQDIRSYYFFTMTFWVFDSMFNALTAFPAERTVILKERASRTYQLSAYFMAKVSSDAPVRLILPLLYMIISYWMAGFDSRFSVFIGTVICTLLSVMAGEAIGLFIGAAIYDLQKAMAFMTVFALGLMLLGGYFVQNIPYWIDWAKYLSPFKYAFDSSLQIVFDLPVPCDNSGALPAQCPNGAEGSIPVSEILELINVNGSIGFNIGLLIAICLVPRYFAYLALRMKKGGDRS